MLVLQYSECGASRTIILIRGRVVFELEIVLVVLQNRGSAGSTLSRATGLSGYEHVRVIVRGGLGVGYWLLGLFSV